MAQTYSSILSSIRNQPSTLNLNEILSNILSVYNCSTGTIHLLDKGSNTLKLHAFKGIPEFLLPKMQEIPIGKGMAGIAAERMKPIEMCNLQTNDSGIALPAAKKTKVEGSIAVPMVLDEVLFGVLGIAKPISYDFTEEEKKSLLDIGKGISSCLNFKDPADI